MKNIKANKIKCKCGGVLVLSMQRGTSYGSDASGRACCGRDWESPEYLFCDECKVMYHISILENKFFTTAFYPFWQALTKADVCKKCTGFEGEENECRGRYHTKSSMSGCTKFYPLNRKEGE